MSTRWYEVGEGAGEIRRHETTEKVKTSEDEMIDGQQNSKTEVIKETKIGWAKTGKKTCQGSKKTDEEEKRTDRKICVGK